MLIKKVYHADPLLCPRCGGKMRIIAFIEAHQQAIIEKILRHCGLWEDRHNRGPPPQQAPPPAPGRGSACTDAPDSRVTYEPDGDFLDLVHRESAGQLDMPFDF